MSEIIHTFIVSMPTKKKPSAPKKKTAAPKKKKIVKKVAPKKKTTKKKPAAKKKTVSKKPAVKKQEVTIQVEVPTKPDGSVKIHKEFVVVHTCNNCDHMPLRVGKLVGIFTFIVAVLSTVILIQLGLINLEEVLLAVSTPVNAATEWVNQL